MSIVSTFVIVRIIYLKILTLLPADVAMILAQRISRLDIHEPQILVFSGFTMVRVFIFDWYSFVWKKLVIVSGIAVDELATGGLKSSETVMWRVRSSSSRATPLERLRSSFRTACAGCGTVVT